MGIDAEMFVRTKYDFTPEELRVWHFRFGMAFHDHLWAFGTESNQVPEELQLHEIKVYEQDGPTIKPEPGERFLRLRPKSRYYGPGYERGNFPILKAMAEFLELLIPESEVWYGGDSSGVLAEKFGPMERQEMLHHWVSNQHMPYADGRNPYMPKQPDEPFCPYCKFQTAQYGWGETFRAYHCLGCGWRHIDRDGTIKTGWKIKDEM